MFLPWNQNPASSSINSGLTTLNSSQYARVTPHHPTFNYGGVYPFQLLDLSGVGVSSISPATVIGNASSTHAGARIIKIQFTLVGGAPVLNIKYNVINPATGSIVTYTAASYSTSGTRYHTVPEGVIVSVDCTGGTFTHVIQFLKEASGFIWVPPSSNMLSDLGTYSVEKYNVI